MIDFRAFDQRERGMRAAAVRIDLLEPNVDEDLADRIRASLCRQRYERDTKRDIANFRDAA